MRVGQPKLRAPVKLSPQRLPHLGNRDTPDSMVENHFDAFRRIGQQALNFSQQWMTHPSHTARDYTDYIFWQVFGKSITGAPLEVTQSIYTNMIIAGRWAMCGFPTVTMGHKTAAAFCATKMRPDDAVEFVRPPWPAFCIRLPNGLLQIIDATGVPRDAQVLMVTALEPGMHEREGKVIEAVLQPPDQHRWWWKLVAPTSDAEHAQISRQYQGHFKGVSLWGFNRATQYLATPDDGETEEGYMRWDLIKTEDSDKRVERLARSLILSTCMYLSGDPRELAQRAAEGGVAVKERKSKKREGDEFPQYRSFEVTSSIKINLTETIREFVKHGGSAPAVQTYVQGHWKRVPYGPGGAERKLTHVQAYWRGDLNAPISTRTK